MNNMVEEDIKSREDGDVKSTNNESKESIPITTLSNIHEKDNQSQARKEALDRRSLQYIMNMTTSPPKTTNTNMDKKFCTKLKDLFQLSHDQTAYFQTLLEKGNITQPATLVNVFGGDIESLLIKIMGLEPSYFLYDMVELTEKLIIFAKLELNLEINSNTIKGTTWYRSMKDEQYNADFMQYPKGKFTKMKCVFLGGKFTFVLHEYISNMQRMLTT